MIDSVSVGAVTGTPRLVLRAEGLVLFALSTAGFAYTGASWLLYGLLFFVPDMSFTGYLGGSRFGAAVYNAAHTTIMPATLVGWGVLAGDNTLVACAAVWGAHIGFDRALGYGLKYATAFGDTHLGRIGRPLAGSA